MKPAIPIVFLATRSIVRVNAEPEPIDLGLVRVDGATLEATAELSVLMRPAQSLEHMSGAVANGNTYSVEELRSGKHPTDALAQIQPHLADAAIVGYGVERDIAALRAMAMRAGTLLTNSKEDGALAPWQWPALPVVDLFSLAWPTMVEERVTSMGLRVLADRVGVGGAQVCVRAVDEARLLAAMYRKLMLVPRERMGVPPGPAKREGTALGKRAGSILEHVTEFLRLLDEQTGDEMPAQLSNVLARLGMNLRINDSTLRPIVDGEDKLFAMIAYLALQGAAARTARTVRR